MVGNYLVKILKLKKRLNAIFLQDTKIKKENVLMYTNERGDSLRVSTRRRTTFRAIIGEMTYENDFLKVMDLIKEIDLEDYKRKLEKKLMELEGRK